MFDSINQAEPISQIRNGIDALAGEARSSWPAVALSERLSEVAELRNQLDAEALRLMGEWDRRRAWEADGALTAVSWMTHRLPVSRSRAQEDVRTARFLDQHERAAKAVSVGDISVDHVRALGRVVNDRRQDLFADHEDALLDAAEVLSVGDFAKVAKQWGRLADDQLASADFMEQYDNRRLVIAKTFQGALHVDGLLDPEGGSIFAAAIDVLSPPDPIDMPGGPRTAAQRRADALVQMSRIILQGAKGTGVSPTNINAIVDIDRLDKHQAGRSSVESRCEIDWSGPIGRETLLRMSCDCAVSRVVMRAAVRSSTWAARQDLPRQHNARHSPSGIRDAPFRAVIAQNPGVTPTTSSTGSGTTGPPTSITLPYSADDTTSSFTKAAGRC
jgi:hypothetical protein